MYFTRVLTKCHKMCHPDDLAHRLNVSGSDFKNF